MATLNELETKLRELNEGLDLVDDKFKAGIRKQIAQTEKDIEALKSSSTPAPESSDPFIQSLLSTIATTMASGEGTGVDTPQVREIIKNYLRDDKVKLAELDKSILDETFYACQISRYFQKLVIFIIFIIFVFKIIKIRCRQLLEQTHHCGKK